MQMDRADATASKKVSGHPQLSGVNSRVVGEVRVSWTRDNKSPDYNTDVYHCVHVWYGVKRSVSGFRSLNKLKFVLSRRNARSHENIVLLHSRPTTLSLAEEHY